MNTRLWLGLLVAGLPTLALAHPGHAEHGFFSGILHPLSGVDHLLVMLAVGWWAAASDQRRWYFVPLAFCAGLFLGAVSGLLLGTPPAGLEVLIALSVGLLGLLLWTRQRSALPVAMALAATLAIAHGIVHATELDAGQASNGAWLMGMLLASLLLHLAGAAIGMLIAGRNAWLTPAAGLGCTLAAAMLLIAAIG